MTFLIGLTGYKGSGKSEVAERLSYKYSFHRSSFAGPLKDMLKALGLNHAWFYGALKEKENKDILNGHTPRYAMQTLGTEWAREHLGEDFWINLWRSKAKTILAASVDARLTVEDTRFPNEVDIIRKFGGEIWYVNRPRLENPDVSHKSEAVTTLISPDRIIINNEGLDTLRENTDMAFLYMKEDKRKRTEDHSSALQSPSPPGEGE